MKGVLSHVAEIEESRYHIMNRKLSLRPAVLGMMAKGDVFLFKCVNQLLVLATSLVVSKPAELSMEEGHKIKALNGDELEEEKVLQH